MRKAAFFCLASSLLSCALAGVAWAYATDAEATEAIATFKKDYATKDDAAREKAVKALGATKHRKVVDTLAGPLTKDPSMTVRRAAASELGAQWAPNAVKVLGSALDPDDGSLKDVQAAIVKALGTTDSDDAVPYLIGLLQKKNAQQRRSGNQGGNQGGGGGSSASSSSSSSDADPPAPNYTHQAIAALEKIASPKGMDDIIAFLASIENKGAGSRGQADLAKSTEQLLSVITGEKLHGPDDWTKWWADNRSTKKVIQIYRCEGTGQTFEKTPDKKTCPHDGDKNPKCGFQLKTKLEGGGEQKQAPKPKGQ